MKGYSLHVGVGFVGNIPNSIYSEDALSLDGAENDAIYMASLMKKNPDNKVVTLLSSENKAKSKTFFHKLKKIIKETKSNHKKNIKSYVVISFSGHGMTYSSKEDSVPQVEFLCFQDRMVLEHEIKQYLLQFDSSVRCFVVLDACYSGGIRDYSITKSGKKPMRQKELNPVEIKRILNEERKQYYVDLIHETAPIYGHTHYKCELCVLSACSSNNVTYDARASGDLSQFTAVIEAVFEVESAKSDESTKMKSYNEFYAALTRNEFYEHNGGPVISGAYSEFFMKNMPFSI